MEIAWYSKYYVTVTRMSSNQENRREYAAYIFLVIEISNIWLKLLEKIL